MSHRSTRMLTFAMFALLLAVPIFQHVHAQDTLAETRFAGNWTLVYPGNPYHKEPEIGELKIEPNTDGTLSISYVSLKSPFVQGTYDTVSISPEGVLTVTESNTHSLPGITILIDHTMLLTDDVTIDGTQRERITGHTSHYQMRRVEAK